MFPLVFSPYSPPSTTDVNETAGSGIVDYGILDICRNMSGKYIHVCIVPSKSAPVFLFQALSAVDVLLCFALSLNMKT